MCLRPLVWFLWCGVFSNQKCNNFVFLLSSALRSNLDVGIWWNVVSERYINPDKGVTPCASLRSLNFLQLISDFLSPKCKCKMNCAVLLHIRACTCSFIPSLHCQPLFLYEQKKTSSGNWEWGYIHVRNPLLFDMLRGQLDYKVTYQTHRVYFICGSHLQQREFVLIPTTHVPGKPIMTHENGVIELAFHFRSVCLASSNTVQR